ncbi:MAG: hypothetical protein KKH97_09820 [Proteobacteria bacterium]|nr:hypothetical protein [Pseudomonadota bacterium]
MAMNIFWKCGLGFRITIFLSILLSMSSFIATSSVRGENNSQVNKGPYDTTLGKLEYGVVIPSGTPVKPVKGGSFTYEYIFLNILPGKAMPVGDELEIYTKGTATTTNTPKVIFVQDISTGDWLATSGVIFFIDSKLFLLNDHEIKIIGGRERPFKIAGQQFYETTLKIKDGKPVKVSE